MMIADAGATKITWVLVRQGIQVAQTRTQGLNALLADRDLALVNFGEASAALGDPGEVTHIYYYGTGCSTPRTCARIASYLSEIWPGAEAEVESDMVLAGRSLLGDMAGVAGILGTGSNAAAYADGHISKCGAGLGYVIGDNGSGSQLGKRLLAAHFKHLLPARLSESLVAETGVTLPDMLEAVYRSPAPARYLASFAPFIMAHRDESCLRELVADEFRLFIERDVRPLMAGADTPVAFTGSIAKTFEAELREQAWRAGITNLRAIEADPIDGIVRYHTARAAASPLP